MIENESLTLTYIVHGYTILIDNIIYGNKNNKESEMKKISVLVCVGVLVPNLIFGADVLVRRGAPKIGAAALVRHGAQQAQPNNIFSRAYAAHPSGVPPAPGIPPRFLVAAGALGGSALVGAGIVAYDKTHPKAEQNKDKK